MGVPRHAITGRKMTPNSSHSLLIHVPPLSIKKNTFAHHAVNYVATAVVAYSHGRRKLYLPWIAVQLILSGLGFAYVTFSETADWSSNVVIDRFLLPWQDCRWPLVGRHGHG